MHRKNRLNKVCKLKKALIGITTFKKTAALDNLLSSMVKHGYSEFPTVIADDFSNLVDKHGKNVEEVVKKYSSNFSSLKLIYNEKTSGLGVAKNKNRLIKEFLSNPCESLLLLDDDILFMNPGLIDHLFYVAEKIKISHINGYWTDFDQDRLESSKLVGLTGNNWYKDFPIKAIGYDEKTQTDLVSFHQGTQGCMVWSKKSAIEKAGYFNKFNYIYGMEHSAYSARLNRIEGLPPELFPVLRRSHYWIMGQNIPNDYSISHEKLNTVQTATYQSILKDVYAGIELKQEDDNLPKKFEKTLVIS